MKLMALRQYMKTTGVMNSGICCFNAMLERCRAHGLFQAVVIHERSGLAVMSRVFNVFKPNEFFMLDGNPWIEG